MKKIIRTLLSLVIVGVGLDSVAQNLTIPDANFKTYLVGNSSINTNGDSEIQVAEAAAYSGTIYCVGLGITDLTGIESFTSLASLNCANNNISSIDVSSNTSLNFLFCTANNLSSIDVSNNLALTHLHCALNNLTVLDVSNNSSLISLQCDRNSLTNLDVSTNTALTEVWCFSNNLSSLDVANGNNMNVAAWGFDATSNPNLSCIKVDDAAYSTTNWSNIDVQTSFSETVCCSVTIPDANFKAYLVGNSAINTDSDSEISCSEAAAFSGAINCNGLNISDLTGIEAFTALIELNCQTNNLTSLDVSNNTALTDLNTSSNSIGNLDVSSNTALINLSCQSNGLDTIDVSNNTDLVFFYCNNNNLENLDVSNNTDMTRLYCYSNALSTLDVTNNTNLIRLWCHTNSLTSLDLSNANALDRFYCYSNSLTSLNVANGNNSNMSGANFIASANPNLNCIIVDDAAYSNASWSNIDAQTSFSETACCISSFSTFSVITCGSYILPSGDETYASSQTVMDTIVNACGGDSIMTINLTINSSTSGIDIQTACDSYVWVDGNTYTMTTSTPTFNIVGGAANGCDSLVTLDLTISNSTTGTDVQTACVNYTWIDGNNYTITTNTPTYNIVGGAANGCDSLLTLDLTINSLPNNTTTTSGLTITANQTGATYQWIDCNNGNSFIAGETNASYTATVNGDYAVIVTSNGCSDTSACVNVATVGVSETVIGNQVNIYPNPIKDVVTVQLGNLREVSLLVYSLTGEIVYQAANINTTTHQFKLNNSAGFYILSVIASGETKQYKLIKE